MTRDSTHTAEGVRSTGDYVDGPIASPGVNPKDANGVDGDVFDALFADEAEEWPAQASTKGFRASWLVTVLVALLLIVGGLTLGAFLQRGQSPATTSASTLGRTFGGAAAAGTGAATGASSATSSVTAGTVTDIIGNTLYVTNASGALVAVKKSSTTTIDRNAASSLSALKPGDTVTVQGPTEKNGSVQAASISDTAKGVTPAGFGGGGFPGRAGGTGASSTG